MFSESVFVVPVQSSEKGPKFYTDLEGTEFGERARVLHWFGRF